MTTQEVANRYYELIKKEEREQIQNELYSENIVCQEPEHTAEMGMQVITKGLVAVKAKGKARSEMIEQVHSSFCTEPVVGGKYFSVAMGRDLTFKGKPRRQLSEIAVFQVENGKIITEQFFY